MRNAAEPAVLAPPAADVLALKQYLGAGSPWHYVEVDRHASAQQAAARWPRLAEMRAVLLETRIGEG